MKRAAAAIVLIFAVTAANDGKCGDADLVDPVKLENRPPTIHAYGIQPLPIVDVGANAAEMIARVYAVGTKADGVRSIRVYTGPCRTKAFANDIIDVSSRRLPKVGDLYFIVPHGTFTAVGFEPIGGGWALRAASPSETRSYETCRWT